jgi:predicted nucleotide-binding protein (sugar kinase/HSP70/actin superfamily)
LLFHHHNPEEKKPLQYVFFPILTHVNSFVSDTMDNASCPIVAGCPEVLKAAFTKEIDFFAQRGIKYLDPALSFSEPLLTRRRLFETFGPLFGITEDENDHAFAEAMKVMDLFDKDLQEKGKAILETVQEENRVAILLIGRPYHLDPGLNHGIMEEFQVLGYPVLSIRSLPKDPKWLAKYFGSDRDPLDLNDVWPENYSANSSQKVWAAKFAARHPHVAVLDLSSFKCGHDSPTYGIIDEVISKAGVPYSALHDIDANKPGGSIKIRIKTYAHTLSLYQERLEDAAKKQLEFERKRSEKKLELIEKKLGILAQMGRRDPALEIEVTTLKNKLGLADAPAAEEVVRPIQITKGQVVTRA